jgi:hypothetical protein
MLKTLAIGAEILWVKQFKYTIAILFLALPAESQELTSPNFLIAPGIFYSSGLTARNSKDERIELRAEVKLAYQVYPQIYFGPTFNLEQTSRKTSGYSSPTLNNLTKGQRQSYGASLVYITTSYHFSVTYFVNSTWNLDTTTSSESTKYAYKGNGFQFDLGYKIPIWGVFFGPQLSYKLLEYSKLSTDGSSSESISPKLKESGLEPSVVLHWFF